MRTTKLAGLTALSLVLFACGSDEGDGTLDTTGASVPASVLMKGSPSPADATCPAGGTKLEFGNDKNGNGQLDADEVTGSQTVCNPGAAPTLTTVTPTGPSAKCTQGGQTVKSGADTNGNGKLDDAEVTATEEICAGGASTELGNTTKIPEGDARCPFGGQSTEVGYDNGANGGVAGDGVLQSGEVLGTVVSCVTGASSTLVPPAGPAGTSKLIASGGAGLAGAGGSGNIINLGTYTSSPDGLGGGNVKIWKTGTLAIDVQVPVSAPVFGATKMDVTANKTIATYGSSASAADGEYYTINNNGLFYRQDGANQQLTVTGIHVAPNVTLTFPATGISVTLSDDFHNEGVVTAALTGNNRGSVNLNISKWVGAPGSKIDLAGAASAAAAGGNGGSFTLQSDKILDQGTIDVSGGAGDANGAYNGGSAGTVYLLAQKSTSAGPVYHVGLIKAKGGASAKANAGSGGTVYSLANVFGSHLKGDVDVSGGVGVNGGNGGTFVVQPNAALAEMSGNVDARGGDVDEAGCGNGACSGGNGGTISFASVGGPVDFSGDVFTSGGKSKNAAGRNGGTMVIATVDGADPVLNIPRAAGRLRIAGTKDSRGGDGTQGGTGGQQLLVISSGRPNGEEIEFFGYASVETNGGNGTTGGGNAGPVLLLNRSTNGGLTGGLAVYPNVVAKGGNASVSGSGGPGSTTTLLAGSLNQGSETKSQALVLAGTLDLGGGNGITGAGPAGPLTLEARERVQVNGSITSKGGNSSGNSAAAGASQAAVWRSGTGFNIDAAITLAGGSATGTTSAGGACGLLQIQSAAIKATAAITCNGGNSTGVVGGASQGISLTSSQAATSYTTLTANGGTGSATGANGPITIDGNML